MFSKHCSKVLSLDNVTQPLPPFLTSVQSDGLHLGGLKQIQRKKMFTFTQSSATNDNFFTY